MVEDSGAKRAVIGAVLEGLEEKLEIDEAESGFAESPYAGLGWGIGSMVETISQVLGFQVSFERRHSRRQLFRRVAVELDAEQAARFAFDK